MELLIGMHWIARTSRSLLIRVLKSSVLRSVNANDENLSTPIALASLLQTDSPFRQQDRLLNQKIWFTSFEAKVLIDSTQRANCLACQASLECGRSKNNGSLMTGRLPVAVPCAQFELHQEFCFRMILWDYSVRLFYYHASWCFLPCWASNDIQEQLERNRSLSEFWLRIL